MGAVEYLHNAAESRYEARLDGEVAGVLDYRLRGDTIVFTHAEVDDAHEGRGVGTRLARFALDDVRAQGTRRVVPQCPFVKSWIERHPDYADLVERAS